MKLIGLAEKQGEYQGTKYHNLNFHCTYKADGETGIGQLSSVEKVKMLKLNECFGRVMTIIDISSLIGSELSFGYDKYGSVNQIRVLEELGQEEKVAV